MFYIKVQKRRRKKCEKVSHIKNAKSNLSLEKKLPLGFDLDFMSYVLFEYHLRLNISIILFNKLCCIEKCPFLNVSESSVPLQGAVGASGRPNRGLAHRPPHQERVAGGHVAGGGTGCLPHTVRLRPLVAPQGQIYSKK